MQKEKTKRWNTKIKNKRKGENVMGYKFRKTLKDQTAMQGQMKGTIYFMLAMIAIATFSLPVALGLYWITSSMFTVVQNKLVEGKKAKK